MTKSTYTHTHIPKNIYLIQYNEYAIFGLLILLFKCTAALHLKPFFTFNFFSFLLVSFSIFSDKLYLAQWIYQINTYILHQIYFIFLSESIQLLVSLNFTTTINCLLLNKPFHSLDIYWIYSVNWFNFPFDSREHLQFAHKFIWRNC